MSRRWPRGGGDQCGLGVGPVEVIAEDRLPPRGVGVPVAWSVDDAVVLRAAEAVQPPVVGHVEGLAEGVDIGSG